MRQYFRTPHAIQTMLLLSIALVIGLSRFIAFWFNQTRDPTRIFSPDSYSYVNSARAILKTGQFAISPDKPNILQVERTPGYPLFIASVFFLFYESYAALIIIQILMSIATIVMTYLIARNLWGPSIASIAAVLLALDVPSYVYALLVLTETLFTWVLTLAVWVGILALRNPQKLPFWLCLHGTLLAWAALIRPIAYYAIVVVTLTCLVILKTRLHWTGKKILFTLAGLILPWMMIVGGWQIRNYCAIGSTTFSTIQGGNLLFYRGADIIAQREGISMEEAQVRLGYGNYRAKYPETKNWSDLQLAQHWQQQGLALIRQYPWLFLKSQIRGVTRIMLGTGEKVLLRYIGDPHEKAGYLRDVLRLPFKQPILKWVTNKGGRLTVLILMGGYFVLLYSGILVSIWQLWPRRPTPSWPDSMETHAGEIHALIWGLMLYFILISAGPEAYSRFRVPMMPLLSIYGGYGVSRMMSRVRTWRRVYSAWGRTRGKEPR
jgi:4-amino-4-deoxy-L-arabinose transferase-like glycosyltransferase